MTETNEQVYNEYLIMLQRKASDNKIVSCKAIKKEIYGDSYITTDYIELKNNQEVEDDSSIIKKVKTIIDTRQIDDEINTMLDYVLIHYDSDDNIRTNILEAKKYFDKSAISLAVSMLREAESKSKEKNSEEYFILAQQLIIKKMLSKLSSIKQDTVRETGAKGAFRRI